MRPATSSTIGALVAPLSWSFRSIAHHARAIAPAAGTARRVGKPYVLSFSGANP
jgi:hypothetical protein